MIDEIIGSGIVDLPWNICIDGTYFLSDKQERLKCKNTECFNQNLSEIGSSILVRKCQHNMYHLSKKVCDQIVTVTEVYLSDTSTPKYIKKSSAYKSRKTTQKAVEQWFEKLESKVRALENIASKLSKRRFDPFHEFVKWANEINFYSERLINKKNFDDSPEDLKSLYKTSIMLIDSLDTAALYFNPDSVSHGRKRPTDLYKMIDKISKVLAHSKSNKSKRVSIRTMGKVKNKHKVYESFKIIPQSLIQNALKYRKTGEIEVVFHEKEEKLDFSVVSYGDLIPKQEIGRIFERGFRTSVAQKMKVEGTGLGLFALKVVADAHDFEVSVRSEYRENNNSSIARNIFTVSIH